MSSTAPPPVPDRIGRYKIERKIGEGGMGVVYAARDERLDRTVALKTIRGETDDTSRKRLWREARAAAGISHPNICQLYEVEETDDGLVMAMELLAGEPLGARVARGPLSPADTSTIALQVLDALDALHARGLIHRDLKPSNLFLTPHGVKLLDFGLARPIASSLGADSATRLTEAGAIVGTPNYMAPEQVRGEALDARADLFALAAMLFEMLSGKVAFDGATMIDVLHAVLHEQPPALSGGTTVAGLDRVIHKALQKQAADRYDSATVMAAAIREVIADRDSAELSAPAARTMTRFIALPFRVLRPDAETDFLSFSLPDAVTTSLTGTRNLLVRSSAAAARFDPQAPDLRKLAADADVDVALMGTILRAGSQLRATAQLVEAPAGTVVWSHSSQHPLEDVFAMQDELVAGIVRSLSQSLGEPDSRVVRHDVPRSPGVYELYLRANELARDWDHLAEARDVYQQCVTLDSQFAPAWAGLGRCQRVLGKYFDDTGSSREAERSFERALALNPDLPVLHKYLRPTRVRRRASGGRDASPAAAVEARGRSRALRRAGPCLSLRRASQRLGGGARGGTTPRSQDSDERGQHLSDARRLRAHPAHRRGWRSRQQGDGPLPPRPSRGGAGGLATRARRCATHLQGVGRDDGRLLVRWPRRARGGGARGGPNELERPGRVYVRRDHAVQTGQPRSGVARPR